ncbi:MAG TPA: response regulator [Stellaceae bacterium]|nr:response regulator [Stellaceae bacterium]
MSVILVIDDERKIRQMVSGILVNAGYDVLEARDGAEGLQFCRTTVVDVVITDIVMPGKEGIETIRELRREYPDIRIVAMSGGGGRDNNAYLEFAQRLGADEIIAKPFRAGDLTAILERLIAKAPQS